MSAETLATIWFALWGVLWAVYFVLDGFDLGVGILFPFLGRSQKERQLLLHAITPFWDGNEVWVLTAGGATFAAFPTTYAVMFSSLYTPLMLILLGLIFRATALEFIGKSESPTWQKAWTWALSLSSLLVALLFGVAFGNIFQGLPIDQTGYHGTLLGLLNPYGLLTGLLFVTIFVLSGALWLAARHQGEVQEQLHRLAVGTWPVVTLLAVVFLVSTAWATNLYQNFLAAPLWLVVPALAVLALLSVRLFLAQRDHLKAFFATSLTILATVFTGVIGLYPNMLPSSIDPRYSLTAFNSSASAYTLTIMLVVALTFVPIVIAYQIWVYLVLRGNLGDEDTLY